MLYVCTQMLDFCQHESDICPHKPGLDPRRPGFSTGHAIGPLRPETSAAWCSDDDPHREVHPERCPDCTASNPSPNRARLTSWLKSGWVPGHVCAHVPLEQSLSLERDAKIRLRPWRLTFRLLSLTQRDMHYIHQHDKVTLPHTPISMKD